MKYHGRKWAGLTQQQKRALDTRAADSVAEKQTLLMQRKKSIVAEMNEVKAKLDRARAFDSPLLLSSCKLSASAIQECEQAFASGGFESADVAAVREEWIDEVAPPL